MAFLMCQRYARMDLANQATQDPYDWERNFSDNEEDPNWSEDTETDDAESKDEPNFKRQRSGHDADKSGLDVGQLLQHADQRLLAKGKAHDLQEERLREADENLREAEKRLAAKGKAHDLQEQMLREADEKQRKAEEKAEAYYLLAKQKGSAMSAEFLAGVPSLAIHKSQVGPYNEIEDIIGTNSDHIEQLVALSQQITKNAAELQTELTQTRNCAEVLKTRHARFRDLTMHA